MANKISLPNTSSIRQRKGIHGRIFRNDTQRLWGKEVTITVRNPQANNIIEMMHQIIGNMIRSFE
eukprot:8564427-Ditylum_brightwellii.AAC.1